MPIYEYRCEECGERFEAWLRSWQSPEPEKCPACGKAAVRRIPSLAAAPVRGGSVMLGGACVPAGST